jgi:hypothetical protein
MIGPMASGSGTEAQRILARYKRMILLGKAKLPLAEGRRLVGPDAAYHLYFRHADAPLRHRRRRRRDGGKGGPSRAAGS